MMQSSFTRLFQLRTRSTRGHSSFLLLAFNPNDLYFRVARRIILIIIIIIIITK